MRNTMSRMKKRRVRIQRMMMNNSDDFTPCFTGAAEHTHTHTQTMLIPLTMFTLLSQ